MSYDLPPTMHLPEAASSVGLVDCSDDSFGGLRAMLEGLRSRRLTPDFPTRTMGADLQRLAGRGGLESDGEGGHDIERALLAGFEAFVTYPRIAEVAVTVGGHPQLDEYWLTPIVASRKATSDYAPGNDVVVERAVRTSPNGNPHLRARQAVGLVYCGALAAFAAARIDSGGVLNVVQFQEQGFAEQHNHRSNGLLWRATLAQVWQRIGERVGASGMAIQANVNSRMATEYLDNDNAATEAGYVHDPITKNWINPHFPNAESRRK